jgi:type I restriction enzyme, S subunit
LNVDQAPFADLLIKVIDNRGKTCPTADSGIALIATNCIKNSYLFPVFERVRYVDEPTYQHWFRGHPEPGDLLFVTKGSPGRVCLVPDPVNFCIAQDMVAIRADRAKIDPGYLLAVLRSPEVQARIENMHVGSLIPHFKKGDFDKLLLPVPEKPIQEFIGKLYLELSRKIDLNERTNTTLEEIALAIFKDWFVNFGPTRSIMEGRGKYLHSDLWALFPELLDAEGKPEGWRWEPLLEHARLISGGTPKTNVPEYWGGEIAWASAKDVSQCGGMFLLETERTITQRGVDQSATRIIPKFGTVVVARGATTGRFCMTGREIAMNQTCYALDSKNLRPFWLSCAFSNLVSGLVNAAHGSVFDTITTKTIEGANVIIASEELLTQFESLVEPFFLKILANLEHSRSLAQTRDILLPRLMCGDVRLNDLEKQLEVVA